MEEIVNYQNNGIIALFLLIYFVFKNIITFPFLPTSFHMILIYFFPDFSALKNKKEKKKNENSHRIK
jgi:hypothetical protein